MHLTQDMDQVFPGVDFIKLARLNERGHCSIGGVSPAKRAGEAGVVVPFDHYRWKKHCRGLFELPIAA